MALDRTTLGTVAAQQMQALEEDYGDNENAQIGAVLTIVQVVVQQPDGTFTSNVRLRHNIPDPYMAIGLIRAAEMTVTQQIVPEH